VHPRLSSSRRRSSKHVNSSRSSGRLCRQRASRTMAGGVLSEAGWKNGEKSDDAPSQYEERIMRFFEFCHFVRGTHTRHRRTRSWRSSTCHAWGSLDRRAPWEQQNGRGQWQPLLSKSRVNFPHLPTASAVPSVHAVDTSQLVCTKKESNTSLEVHQALVHL
jgi:hypothetical protein